MKTEPSEFSLADLTRKKRTFWDGIRNYQVRNMLRDEMKVGDRALMYHSNAKQETGAVGIMDVVQAATPDPTQFEPESKYFDATANKKEPRWLGITVALVAALPRLVTLTTLRADKIFANSPLVKKGNRLSVIKLTELEFKRVVFLSQQEL